MVAVLLLEMDSISTSMIKGDVLFLKHGNDISDGAGLLMGRNSPFQNIPVLGWLL